MFWNARLMGYVAYAGREDIMMLERPPNILCADALRLGVRLASERLCHDLAQTGRSDGR